MRASRARVTSVKYRALGTGLVIGLLAGLLVGCDRHADAPPPRPTVPAGKGVIAGTVTLAGPIPAMREIASGPCHPGGGKASVTDESVVADDAGRLANVVVYVKDGPPVDVPAGAAVELDQRDCRYVPHVVAVRTGRTLRVRSSDPTLHNVEGQCEANPKFNFGMTAAGQTRDLTFARPETFRVKCAVHPWMTGYVAVFDHPLFAVTAAGGRFEIKSVPPGTYTLVAWHERYGTVERQVTVPTDAGPDAPVTQDFAFGAGAAGMK